MLIKKKNEKNYINTVYILNNCNLYYTDIFYIVNIKKIENFLSSYVIITKIF